jgi:4-hydroxy-3-polyprenylbenzoate decarboxylase
VTIAAAGEKRRNLPVVLPAGMTLPEGFDDPRLCLPGIMAVRGPRCFEYRPAEDRDIARFCTSLGTEGSISSFPLIVVVDDSEFTARTLNNFLWVTFTRSNPAADIYGIGESCQCKHWGCAGPLIIDARAKPHHAPVLEDDPDIERRVDALGAPGGPLHGII